MRPPALTHTQVDWLRRQAHRGATARELAENMSHVSYFTVRNAIIGHSAYRNIGRVQPLDGLPGIVAEETSCVNCGQTITTVSRQICPRCYLYRWRNGTDRPATGSAKIPSRRVNVPDGVFRDLFRRYRAGEVVADLAADVGISVATLYRHWRRLNLHQRRGRARLTSGIVRHMREMVASGSVSISEAARYYDVPVSTAHSAITGRTWPRAGGPVVGTAGMAARQQQACQQCQILCDPHPGGLCHWCRVEQRNV